MKTLEQYFTEGISSTVVNTVGAEIETSFITSSGFAISLTQSQQIFDYLVKSGRWNIVKIKGEMIVEIQNKTGAWILYELGRQNIELVSPPYQPNKLIKEINCLLGELYESAERCGAYPLFEPILRSDEDLLVVPDKRDKVWVDLDGRFALNALANISAVQFTFQVSPEYAISTINTFGESIEEFLDAYPQDVNWRYYIYNSKAKYNNLRYGGPLIFQSMHDYCQRLQDHDVISDEKLVPHKKLLDFDIPLFLRSVWWYFRLKRYNNALCVEVRPFARQTDAIIEAQLDQVLQLIY